MSRADTLPKKFQLKNNGGPETDPVARAFHNATEKQQKRMIRKAWAEEDAEFAAAQTSLLDFLAPAS